MFNMNKPCGVGSNQKVGNLRDLIKPRSTKWIIFPPSTLFLANLSGCHEIIPSALPFSSNDNISANFIRPGSLIVQKMLAFLFFPIVALMIIIFIVRTLGIASSFMFPDVKAVNIETSEKNVILFLENGKTDSFSIENIQSIVLTYNYRGLYINSLNKKNSYSLPIEPIDIEQKIDVLTSLKKEVFFLESKEGNIRSVRYTKN
ncbi:MAG: hypothetical protein A2W52_01885 [Candidatus Taylorbacteria bacterium RIFCSPHIGHO2_02_49_25]|uniref:Uncharacterized protein n=1 Tax=Candidatus Taylorbacteria bacterium RIFCSPHIGHO2_02_49_25 TaxID=1802305 RepID=A0A1G2MCB7_9BACT|nr:MAG: hypothetical protein A2W52_01885 [Candidatus Taylorbacteria bacterium RIFCSPHIGHO2_02_49_25]